MHVQTLSHANTANQEHAGAFCGAFVQAQPDTKLVLDCIMARLGPYSKPSDGRELEVDESMVSGADGFAVDKSMVNGAALEPACVSIIFFTGALSCSDLSSCKRRSVSSEGGLIVSA